ncbi:MAG: cell division protein FtsA, partial [Candidatus Pacebacteria bacterium]|nr:cell division protein FtsA [Candidatus Paceibacterota bacterium]
MKNAFLSLDIGSNNIYAVLFKYEQKPQILFSIKRPSNGIRKGDVQNINEVVNSVSDLLEEIEQATATNVSQIVIGIGGTKINMNNSRGIAYISGRNNTVDKETIFRAQNSSKALCLPPGRATLHAIPQKYIIDGNEFDVEPLNMTGMRLEVESAIIDVDLMMMNHIAQLSDSLGIRIPTIFASPLSGCFSTLNKREKDLGVVGIDLGASTTTMTVFEEDKLIFMKVLPIGCGKISDDICLFLQIP